MRGATNFSFNNVNEIEQQHEQNRNRTIRLGVSITTTNPTTTNTYTSNATIIANTTNNSNKNYNQELPFLDLQAWSVNAVRLERTTHPMPISTINEDNACLIAKIYFSPLKNIC